MEKANLFIVGFPKSGTSSLYFWLKQHPNVFMSNKKEPSFFSKDFELVGQIKNRNEYNNLFLKAYKEKIIGEASTSYSFSKEAPIKIKKYNPEAKIIFIIRDFSDMLESLYIHRVHRTGDPIRNDFRKWFETRFIKKDGRIGKNFYPFWNLLNPYKTISLYIKLFGKNNVFLLDFRKLSKNPEGAFVKTCNFLNIDYVNVKLNIQNKTFGSKSIFIEKVGHFMRRYLCGDDWIKYFRFWEKNRIMKKPRYIKKRDREHIDNLFLEDTKKIKALMNKLNGRK